MLSPLSSAELNDFIERYTTKMYLFLRYYHLYVFLSSLQEALFESAVEYYASHSKRVRRKKGRFPLQATPIPPGSGPSTGRPLRGEGWVVRYEVSTNSGIVWPNEQSLIFIRILVQNGHVCGVSYGGRTCAKVCLCQTRVVLPLTPPLDTTKIAGRR